MWIYFLSCGQGLMNHQVNDPTKSFTVAAMLSLFLNKIMYCAENCCRFLLKFLILILLCASVKFEVKFYPW